MEVVQGNEIVWSAVLAWMAAKGIEMLKASSWVPAVNFDSETLNRWVARGVALVAAFGVHMTFDSAAGTLTITGLTMLGLRDSILEYARQYMFQEVAYKKFVRKGV